ncbi:MAG: S8 family peptidase [Lachnospiraceae bacterium]
MENQKLENLLNLALGATEEERRRSENLNVGYDAEERLWEVIIKYTGNIERIRQTAVSVTELFGGFAVLRVNEQALELLSTFPEVTYIEKPKLFYFAIQEARRASCIDPVQRPPLNLSGKGVIFALADSGVDYTHPDFRNPDGSTRILWLWDQSIPGNPPAGYFRGTEYTSAEINTALQAETPEERRRLVPSRDISGHGTSVLGIGAGNGRGSGGRFRGVAYEADLIVVKLGNPREGDFPRTTQLMEAVDYCIRKSVETGKPIAVNLSFGNNYGSHTGSGLLETYLDTVSGIGKNTICVGMGNEGVSGVHQSLILQQGKEEVAEFSVGEFQFSTSIQIWKSYSDEMDIYLEGPSRKIVGPLNVHSGIGRFYTDQTDVLVYFGEPSPYEVMQEIYIDLIPRETYLTSGIWKLRLQPGKVVWNLVQLWMPSSESTSGQTGFLMPSPAGSFTIPAPAGNVISVAAYNSRNDSYADFSGRAFQALPWAGKPDLAAPGVDIQTSAVGGGYRTVSGTSFATPFVTGSAALLMEWGIVRGKDLFLYGNKVKAYLRKGARELPGFAETPNYRVGYGALCVKDSLPI